jgi:hypothetical protein
VEMSCGLGKVCGTAILVPSRVFEIESNNFLLLT